MASSIYKELNEVRFDEFPEIYKKFRSLANRYQGLSMDGIISAFSRVTGRGGYALNNPYIQNRRVKAISSLPADYTKDAVADMITSPDTNELPLRQVAHALEYTAYPLFHTRKVYQDLLTYHSYITPAYVEAEDMKKADFFREWRLLEKLRDELNPAAWAHQIAGQMLQEGKVFYVPRIQVDKAHNRVEHAFLQQLPSDWTKIVGLNNISKYTVAFNLFYFLQPGTTPAQFGNLFTPYLQDFQELVIGPPAGTGKRIIFASTPSLDFAKYTEMRERGTLQGNPEVYYQNGQWFYWVTLPVDRVFPFETDDVNRNAVSPFTGLFISLIQLAQYEQIQLELVQNPLVSLLTGEIPYRDEKSASAADAYKLSNGGRKLFEALWYQMLEANNTSGIGLYMAPLENMTLHTLAEAPGATEISANGYGYTMAKAGLSGIIPTTDDPRVGLASISLQIESRFNRGIYRDFMRMMQCIIRRLQLRYTWKFVMFGDLASDKETEESARQGMTLGLLPCTLVYNALHDSSILDDLCISQAISESGLLDMRIPLVSSYSAKNPESGLPPQAKHDLNPGGRPTSEGAPQSEGQEADDDAGV